MARKPAGHGQRPRVEALAAGSRRGAGCVSLTTHVFRPVCAVLAFQRPGTMVGLTQGQHQSPPGTYLDWDVVLGHEGQSAPQTRSPCSCTRQHPQSLSSPAYVAETARWSSVSTGCARRLLSLRRGRTPPERARGPTMSHRMGRRTRPGLGRAAMSKNKTGPAIGAAMRRAAMSRPRNEDASSGQAGSAAQSLGLPRARLAGGRGKKLFVGRLDRGHSVAAGTLISDGDADLSLFRMSGLLDHQALTSQAAAWSITS